MRSSIALVRWAVVRPDSPPPIVPSSTTITFLPAFVSMYAVESPAMPAPTMHTSVRALPRRAGNVGMSKVPYQMDAVSPPGNVLCAVMCVLLECQALRERLDRNADVAPHESSAAAICGHSVREFTHDLADDSARARHFQPQLLMCNLRQ
jgi:hypothetical protein